jgi:hypothetical protein
VYGVSPAGGGLLYVDVPAGPKAGRVDSEGLKVGRMNDQQV